MRAADHRAGPGGEGAGAGGDGQAAGAVGIAVERFVDGDIAVGRVQRGVAAQHRFAIDGDTAAIGGEGAGAPQVTADAVAVIIRRHGEVGFAGGDIDARAAGEIDIAIGLQQVVDGRRAAGFGERGAAGEDDVAARNQRHALIGKVMGAAVGEVAGAGSAGAGGRATEHIGSAAHLA